MPSEFSNFIRVVEVWTLDESGESLILNDALYGELESFGALSEQTSFAYGEGLPGKAWKEKRPIVLKNFDETTFFRVKEARIAGLTTGVAIPIFEAKDLTAVLVMLCGDVSNAKGAIEVWQDDQLSGMALVDGYYGDLERFEWLSKSIKFPKGSGLPGGVWKDDKAMVIGDLANSSSFLRARNAVKAGITTGIGLPFYSPDSSHKMSAVLTFLSAENTPLASRFEVWTESAFGELTFSSGINQTTNKVEPADDEKEASANADLIKESLEKRIPRVSNQLQDDDFDSMLVIPILNTQSGRSAAVFYN